MPMGAIVVPRYCGNQRENTANTIPNERSEEPLMTSSRDWSSWDPKNLSLMRNAVPLADEGR